MKRFVLFLGALAVIPFFLPRRTRVVRKVWINAHPAEIFPFINTLKNWPLWTAWGRTEDGAYTYEGPESGEGATQKWATPRHSGSVRILGSIEDERVSYALHMDGSFGSIEGVIKLESEGKGTLVTWACWWVTGQNPYFRYVDLALRGWIGRDFQLGLNKLNRLVCASQDEMLWQEPT
jgi:hypothetical protein